MSKTWNATKEEIAAYYTALLEKYGPGPLACDYGRPESQQIKFRVLSEIMDLSGKSILDVGCGYADFVGYLQTCFSDIDYTGVDITPSCIEGAKKNFPDADLQVLDILSEDPGGHYDLVTANGIFYLIQDDPEGMMKKLVSRMFELCSGAVAFNSLSSWCPDQEEGEFYADPLRTLEFCRTLTPWVTLRHDYHSRDFTVYMYKEKNS